MNNSLNSYKINFTFGWSFGIINIIVKGEKSMKDNKIVEFYSTKGNFKINEVQANFIKELTGKECQEEALEHFAVTCFRYLMFPEMVLSVIIDKLPEGLSIEKENK